MPVNELVYEGSNFLRQRLILSTLSGRPVKIKKIRHKNEHPGLKEYEANLLRLLDLITNGTKIVISVTGTTLVYEPGVLSGGNFEHDCNNERTIGYYLEVLLCLAPFAKHSIKAMLRGITNGPDEPSVDFIKETSLPLMRKFGIIANLEIKINKRGAFPKGGGEIEFSCPVSRKLNQVQFTDPGKIKRIRGVAYACRVSPQIPNRLVESTRGVLNNFLTDIYIYTDHRKGAQSGSCPGFGLCLYAETTEGHILAAEASPVQTKDSKSLVPEDIGILAANSLLEEICSGGCVDSCNQYLAALFLALGDQNVGKILVGSLTQYTIEFLRHLRDFFGVMFKFEVQEGNNDEPGYRVGDPKVLLTCVGVAFSNISKVTR